MMSRTILVVYLFASIASFSQENGALIRGLVLDAKSGDTLMFANVVLEQNDTVKYAAATGLGGKFVIDSIKPGTYKLKAGYVGYGLYEQDSIALGKNQNHTLLIQMKRYNNAILDHGDYWYVIPIIEQDASPGLRIGGNLIRKAAVR